MGQLDMQDLLVSKRNKMSKNYNSYPLFFQVILPLLKSDLYEVIQSTLDGLLCASPPAWLGNCVAVTVVMASRGYPGDYAKGVEITGECWRIGVDFSVAGD